MSALIVCTWSSAMSLEFVALKTCCRKGMQSSSIAPLLRQLTTTHWANIVKNLAKFVDEITHSLHGGSRRLGQLRRHKYQVLSRSAKVICSRKMNVGKNSLLHQASLGMTNLYTRRIEVTQLWPTTGTEKTSCTQCCMAQKIPNNHRNVSMPSQYFQRVTLVHKFNAGCTYHLL